MSVSETIKILVVDDETDFRNLVNHILQTNGYETESASNGQEAITLLQEKHFDLVLLDLQMPGMSGLKVLEFIQELYPSITTIICTAMNDVHMAVECMHKGAFYYILKPYRADELLRLVSRGLEFHQLRTENATLRIEHGRHNLAAEPIIARSRSMCNVLQLVERVASSDAPVLLQGETGVGKEVLANHLWKKSTRANGPFIAVNCSNFSDTLLESDLFGHEKGAFTDAKVQKQGIVEFADGGMLFLDEIGDLAPTLQPKLLRFIQTGEFRRVGGAHVIHADVRVISATNKVLADEVDAGRFREDLFFRLNVITIEIPPLRERPEDLPLFIEHILKCKTTRNICLSDEALRQLLGYNWPGNVRELENVLERAWILSDKTEITTEDILLPRRASGEPKTVSSKLPVADRSTLREIERRHIFKVLEGTNWDKKQTAEILDISLKTLYTKIAAYNLENENPPKNG